MARLIDADRLLTNVVAVSNSKGQVTWSAVSVMNILTAPTVDAVEVVRCKGCKKRDTNLCPLYHCVSPMITSMDDDFCSHGERKDNG